MVSYKSEDLNKAVFKNYLLSLSESQISILAENVNDSIRNYNFARVLSLEQVLDKIKLKKSFAFKNSFFKFFKAFSGKTNNVHKKIISVLPKTSNKQDELSKYSFSPSINNYYLPSESREKTAYERLYNVTH